VPRSLPCVLWRLCRAHIVAVHCSFVARQRTRTTEFASTAANIFPVVDTVILLFKIYFTSFKKNQNNIRYVLIVHRICRTKFEIHAENTKRKSDINSIIRRWSTK
jgi:hypothetical protein